MNRPQIVYRVERNHINGKVLRNVSVLSNRRSAVAYGRAAFGNGVLYEISTRTLQMDHVEGNKYRISDVVPQENIQRMTQFQDEPRAEIDRIPDRRFRPGREYNHEAEGWYSDEDDALEDIDMNHSMEYAMNH